MTRVPFTILLVDDSPINLELWPTVLRDAGYDVLAAGDGETALELLRSETVDLVLLDVVMPGMSGFEVLERLRVTDHASQTPVIMATSKDESADVVRAFDLGANDYVTKPLDLQVTLARIQAQLRGRQPKKERILRSTEDALTNRPRPQEIDQPLEIGSVLAGRYRLDSLIGKGNFGTVYRADHMVLERPVAVKVLRTEIDDDEVSFARFRQEGVSLSRLQHPNAVAVLDFDVREKTTFLVMELLSGTDLETDLQANGPYSPQRAGEILLPICDVLAEAHALGIIHRDVKPQNIFLHQSRRGEVVKVLDFGIAKLVGDTELKNRLTVEGSSLGTPAYMAPERFTNEAYDGRADVYSLSVMLYEMLTGISPFAHADGNFFKLIRMHVIERPKPLRAYVPDLPKAVEDLVLAGLEKRADDRPDAAELASAYAKAIGLEPRVRRVSDASETSVRLREALWREGLGRHPDKVGGDGS